jgi:hypothetical protein
VRNEANWPWPVAPNKANSLRWGRKGRQGRPGRRRAKCAKRTQFCQSGTERKYFVKKELWRIGPAKGPGKTKPISGRAGTDRGPQGSGRHHGNQSCETKPIGPERTKPLRRLGVGSPTMSLRAQRGNLRRAGTLALRRGVNPPPCGGPIARRDRPVLSLRAHGICGINRSQRHSAFRILTYRCL